ncbi:hypothetical protein Cs7R123_69850 [Catellatospora sp. TT07R-123]|uniref:DUF3093 domain-containing protein n=1 Tax=Catellatospora sp. TT07R-123 TaxID=2733863 RepID=UPI001B285811|nr:DUF3093 domain-containing protein [Catellatospora sp. TT07R-123]GHJ49643.1 hypothetical protein Cs7R123_69850 [Catellatospora sp. TT07R-123]
MASSGTTATGVGAARPAARHTERLTVPLWMWPVAVLVAGVLAAEIGLGAPGLRTWMPYAVLLPLALAGLWRLGRIRVAVTGDEFQVDDARLPLRAVSRAIALDGATRRELLGPSADPLAFVVQRPWIAEAVQVVLDDPDDITPYWVVSTRRPDALARALNEAAAAAR